MRFRNARISSPALFLGLCLRSAAGRYSYAKLINLDPNVQRQAQWDEQVLKTAERTLLNHGARFACSPLSFRLTCAFSLFLPLLTDASTCVKLEPCIESVRAEDRHLRSIALALRPLRRRLTPQLNTPMTCPTLTRLSRNPGRQATWT